MEQIVEVREVELAVAGVGRLHRKLSAFGVLLLTLSCLSPVVSIYGVGSDVLAHTGTGAAGLFVLGIGAAAVWAIVYAEIASAYPYAGGDYVGVGSILGPWAGVASLCAWAAIGPPSTAYLALVTSQYAAELAPSCPAGLVVLGALALATLVAVLAVRTSAPITGVFLALELAAVAALIFLGLSHPMRGLGQTILHPARSGPHGGLVPAPLAAMALGAVSAAYASTGGNQAIGFGEELRDAHRRMGDVVLAAGLIGAAATALPVIMVVIGSRSLGAVLSSPTPLAAFVSSESGPWATRALSAAVVMALFNALIVQIMFVSRLYFSLGRDGVLHRQANRLLASVHGPSGAPRIATLVVAGLSAACCLLGAHTLVVFISGLTVVTLPLVSLAVIVGRRKGLTGQPGYWRSPLFPLAPVLGLVMSAGFLVADLFDPDAGRPGILILAAIIAAGVAWYGLVLRRRPGGWAPRLDL